MQEPTHILAGIIIQKSFARVQPRALALGLTAVTAFLSHGFLDELARITYHPADPDFHSPFWVCYHAAILLTTIAFVWLWWKPCKWGIAFAALPDLDWVFIHGQGIFHAHLSWYQHPHLHDLLNYIYHQIPPFSSVAAQIERLPNHRHQPWACLWELLLVSVLLLVIRLMTMAQRPVKRRGPLEMQP
jgi:hypothetical protein